MSSFSYDSIAPGDVVEIVGFARKVGRIVLTTASYRPGAVEPDAWFYLKELEPVDAEAEAVLIAARVATTLLRGSDES